MILECVVNVSEGRDRQVLDELAGAAPSTLLDLHADPDHHRAVLTLAGRPDLVEQEVRTLTSLALARLDLRHHHGVHPRLGTVDVVPFVALEVDPATGDLLPGDPAPALGAQHRFGEWLAEHHQVPSFFYGAVSYEMPPAGSARTLPDVRRSAFNPLTPDRGPSRPHPTAGAVAVGVRRPLVAYNLWVDHVGLRVARQVAAAIRGPAVRALGLAVGSAHQISCNLIDPWAVGPAEVFDRIEELLREHGVAAVVARAELVGLIPRAVLQSTPATRWSELDLDPDRTIEARLARLTEHRGGAGAADGATTR